MGVTCNRYETTRRYVCYSAGIGTGKQIEKDGCKQRAIYSPFVVLSGRESATLTQQLEAAALAPIQVIFQAQRRRAGGREGERGKRGGSASGFMRASSHPSHDFDDLLESADGTISLHLHFHLPLPDAKRGVKAGEGKTGFRLSCKKPGITWLLYIAYNRTAVFETYMPILHAADNN